MSEYKYTAICHTKCYWLDTLWEVGETYEGDIEPIKHFNESGQKEKFAPPPDAGSDRRSNIELRKALKKLGVVGASRWPRKKLWNRLKEAERELLMDSQTEDAVEMVRSPCGFMSKGTVGAATHERSCSKCKEMKAEDGNAS